MKENQTNNSESTKVEQQYRFNVEQLKRTALHSQKDNKESNMYPSDEIAEDLEELSSNNDVKSIYNINKFQIFFKSPYKKSSCSSDISLEKPIRRRPHKKSNLNKSESASSKDNKDQSEAKQNNVIGVIFVLFVCVLIAVLLWKFYSQTTTKDGINIENLINEMKNKFSSQPSITFRIVKLAIKSAASEDSLTPGILVLLASKEAKDVSSQFASHIAKTISDSFVEIKSDSFKSPEELKKDIDVTIKRNLSENELKAVIVDDLDCLPFEAAMIFHSYCDHENAPFKKALYIMTITSDEKILSSTNSKMFDIIATQRLNSVWKNSGNDQVSSLISRLTVSVAGIMP